ncbi:hypothetical protein B296_00022194 [Ensete ventricosum]|uniref:Uncharacterized protein n=1 Tax=Ensete ventricosum TaxID=4639 RepID=A0A426YKM1_ENSVE|nr:hypothetical protein B296_00022194 [Ensete ventricosum]
MLATKLDGTKASGVLGKRDHAKWDVLLNDRKSYAKLTEVRGIANSKNLVLMQGLVCGRWSVRGHPKATGTQRHGALKLSLRHGMDMSVIQLAEVKLGSEGLSMGQEDVKVGVTREWVGEGELPKEHTQSEVAEALRWATGSSTSVNNTTARTMDSRSECHGTAEAGLPTSESHGGDLIIQRYDRSDWRVRLLQCLYSLKGARQVRGQGRVVERVEKVTTSPEGLSYPKAKRRLERRWTRRSVIVPLRRIY